MNKQTLSITIPTYNRPEILEKTILSFIDESLLYDINVYISDDSTNNLTENLILKLQKTYPKFKIHYHKNPINLGHDKNCIKALSLSSQDYIWYLGDSCSINRGGTKNFGNNQYQFSRFYQLYFI
ncbi:MAG: glycosyltransferase [Cruoricaptor ignavus]|nr:glycosyltransferase [Cruoricaptor ignavus]